jgi:hypothetical protein
MYNGADKFSTDIEQRAYCTERRNKKRLTTTDHRFKIFYQTLNVILQLLRCLGGGA